MKKFDREDIVLLIFTIIGFIALGACIITGVFIFKGQETWNSFYLIMTVSVGVLFIYALLSFIMKLRQK